MKTTLLTLILALGVSLSATAQDTKVLLCFPGGPGSTADAQPIVDRFLQKLAPRAGWSGASGAYLNDLDDCRKRVEADSPSVVIVPLDLYLERRADWKMSAVSTLQNKETSGRYHLVAKTGATLDGLKGQKVATGLAASARFFSRVGFAGKVDVEADFEFDRERSPLRAVKAVVKGKAAAAILDDVQQKSLEGLPMAKDLQPVLSGPALPGAIVGVVGAAQPRLASALGALCKEDKAACEDMRITGFEPVDSKQLTQLEKQLQP